MEFSCEHSGEFSCDGLGCFFTTPNDPVEFEGSQEASYGQEASYRLRLRPFESFDSTEKCVRLLNSYYEIWFGIIKK